MLLKVVKIFKCTHVSTGIEINSGEQENLIQEISHAQETWASVTSEWLIVVERFEPITFQVTDALVWITLVRSITRVETLFFSIVNYKIFFYAFIGTIMSARLVKMLWKIVLKI